MTDGQPELFQMAMVGDREVVRGPAPEPPTGPKKGRPELPNSRAAYWAWRRTEGGQEVWYVIERSALDAAKRGEKRISTKALVEQVRVHLKREINNSWTAVIADELVERHPHLLSLIQRRKRARRA